MTISDRVDVDALHIEGSQLRGGSVSIAGFKHSLVPIICSTVMGNGPVVLENIPSIEDSLVLADILSQLGGAVRWSGDRLQLDTATIGAYAVPPGASAKIHGVLYLIPCLLARCGAVEIGPSGGCSIGDDVRSGARPTGHIVDVLEQFGASFTQVGASIRGTCRGLHGAHIDIRRYSAESSVVTGPLVSGATKTAILAGATARGTSVIDHPYPKPDVTELVAFLAAAGVSLYRDGSRLVIEGSPSLRPVRYPIMSDLIEIVTFIAYAVFWQRELRLDQVTIPQVRAGLAPELAVLDAMGVPLEWGERHITVRPPATVRAQSIRVTSQSIYSDSHPFFTLMLLLADGPSVISEAVWRDRFDYARQLVRLGANLAVRDGAVRITPARPACPGRHVHAADLRSAAVLLLAALGITGCTRLTGAGHLRRGYHDLIGKLCRLGARITPAPDAAVDEGDPAAVPWTGRN